MRCEGYADAAHLPREEDQRDRTGASSPLERAGAHHTRLAMKPGPVLGAVLVQAQLWI